MIRTFIAIGLSPQIQANLATLIKGLKGEGSYPVKWTAVDKIHITLKFLGDVAEQRLPQLQKKLADAIGECSPFFIHIGGVGAFPRPGRPRILWVGCNFEKSGLLVQQATEAAMNEMGFPPEERTFNPHLTIGRVSNPAGSYDFIQLESLIKHTNAANLGTLQVNSIRMYRSDLHASGSQYRVLYTLQLGSPISGKDEEL